MARCTTCGALLGSGAEWCGQCYALVGPPAPEGLDRLSAPAESGPSRTLGPTEAQPVSPNGEWAPGPQPDRPAASGTPALAAAAAMAAIPPDLQITLASGSSGRVAPLSDRGKTWVTALIVLTAAGSDALFFPYARYMVIYGLFVSLISALAIWRLWGRRSRRA